jgi:hypothetical protein
VDRILLKILGVSLIPWPHRTFLSFAAAPNWSLAAVMSWHHEHESGRGARTTLQLAYLHLAFFGQRKFPGLRLVLLFDAEHMADAIQTNVG